MKNKWKTQENTPQNHEELKATEFPAKQNLGEDGEKEEEKNREERRKLQKFSSSPLPIGLYKEKNKVKDNFWLWEKLPNGLPTSLNHPY